MSFETFLDRLKVKGQKVIYSFPGHILYIYACISK